MASFEFSFSRPPSKSRPLFEAFILKFISVSSLVSACLFRATNPHHFTANATWWFWSSMSMSHPCASPCLFKSFIHDSCTSSTRYDATCHVPRTTWRTLLYSPYSAPLCSRLRCSVSISLLSDSVRLWLGDEHDDVGQPPVQLQLRLSANVGLSQLAWLGCHMSHMSHMSHLISTKTP